MVNLKISLFFTYNNFKVVILLLHEFERMVVAEANTVLLLLKSSLI